MSDRRTYADRREYLIRAVAKRRKKLRELTISQKGGKCFFCGYNRSQAALDFHHLDESRKSFGISKDGITRSWKKVLQEIDKCLLVCANCHREIHAGILQPSMETLERKSG